MSFTNKIDEWMKEAEERPESAILQKQPDHFPDQAVAAVMSQG